MLLLLHSPTMTMTMTMTTTTLGRRRRRRRVLTLLDVIIIPVLTIPPAAAFSTIPYGSSSTSTRNLSSSALSSSQQVKVKVWDNVIHPSSALQEYAAASGLGHKCFTRPLISNTGENYNNIIERTIDAILTEIENEDHPAVSSTKQCYVEYWTRQEWRHIEAHADVDENLSKQFDQQKLNGGNDNIQSSYPVTYQEGYGHRYPTFGHVLYLQVGTNVKGPTCIFPGRSSGGDLLRSTYEDKSENKSFGDDNDEMDAGETVVPLCIVPAVAGRLLRFDGRDLHAVPRPTDIWMLPFVQGAAQYEPKEEWGRSVILFNVWPGDELPPLDVPLDCNRETQDGNMATDASFCKSFSDWNQVKITQNEPSSFVSDSESNKSVKVWLLGSERRRDHPMRTVSLVAPAKGGRDALREALNADSKITELLLRQQQR